MKVFRLLFACFLHASLLGTHFGKQPGTQHVNEIQKPIVVIVPSYNNALWYRRNLDSICTQQYDNFRVIYIDDASTDKTYELVRAYIQQKKWAHKVTLVRNAHNQGALFGIYQEVHKLPDTTIVVNVDGDDWLAHPRALSVINQTYVREKVLLTYGQFRRSHNSALGHCRPYPDDIVRYNRYRKYQWVASHPRTYYAGLFKKINKEDLMFDGEFLRVAVDVAQMIPMLEMAGGRYRCIEEVLYVYNHQNPLSHMAIHKGEQFQHEQAKITRNRPKYSAISDNEACALTD